MKLSLFILICIQAIAGQAQIAKSDIAPTTKIGEVKSTFFFVSDLSYSIINNDTAYWLSYNNAELKTDDIHRIGFKNIDGTLDQLYLIFKQGFDADKGTRNRFKLGSDEISVVTVKDMGIKYIEIRVLGKGYFRLESRRQLEKLFGKR